jgi:hypothetical protein
VTCTCAHWVTRHRKGALARMPDVAAAIVAFISEHRRCGTFQSGQEGAYVWLECSCGSRIEQPLTLSPSECAAGRA